MLFILTLTACEGVALALYVRNRTVMLLVMCVLIYATSTLLTQIFDYLLTLPEELELVWNSRFTMMKLAFLLDRYFIVPNFVVQQLRKSDDFPFE